MSTVQGIIDEINENAPNHGVSDATFVRWFNKLQNKYKQYNVKEEIHEFETVANQAIYSLPSDCIPNLIEYVGLCQDTTITNDSVFYEYVYKGLKENSINYYSIFNNLITLYPVPDTTGYNVKIIYHPAYTALTTSSLSYIPDMDINYHDIYVFDACQRLFSSGNAPNTTLANYYETKVKETEELIIGDWMKYKSKIRTKNPCNEWWKSSGVSSTSIINS